ncbi:hypothetical protein ATL39_1923 [Sinobaca qinghaiensis]|uniref:Glycosyl hydrolase family 8 n=2 Tax=Sinobaca qinghaiensis TaxID=342944 RepID=A0A419V596_9BACL|nr:hypothetical protein ATL39_1923 [Sinobaca qinghaiensis]
MLVVILIIAALVGTGIYFYYSSSSPPPPPSEEVVDSKYPVSGFIQTWMLNDNGTVATYIQDGDVEDSDEVKGRESLSETLGLWMDFALKENDEELFHKGFEQLQTYFLEEDGFVHWKIQENGNKMETTNALVDDIRLVEVLYKGFDRWDKAEYQETAQRIASYTTEYNLNENVLTDFYETNDEYASDVITLSYIDMQALRRMRDERVLDQQIYDNMERILEEAPLRNGFFPKGYNVEETEYEYDESVNIVDQSLVALYRAQSGGQTSDFLAFIRKEMDDHGQVFGQYDIETKEENVEYESPAIYGLLVMYCLAEGEEELAMDIFDRLKVHQNSGNNDQYAGGYSVYDDDTHVFDNLLPLLAEQQLRQKKLI